MKRTCLTLAACILTTVSVQAATFIWNGDLTSGSWSQDDAQPADVDIFVIDQAYDQNRAAMIRAAWDAHTASAVRFNFGLLGRVTDAGGSYYSLGGRQYQFTGNLDLTVDPAEAGGAAAGTYVIETRWLLVGNNIWNREGWNGGSGGPNYLLSEFFDEQGGALTKVTGSDPNNVDDNVFIGTGIADVNTGLTATEADYGKYAFVATYNEGIGIQYVRLVIPEPATATLGLAGLAALGLLRRRHS